MKTYSKFYYVLVYLSYDSSTDTYSDVILTSYYGTKSNAVKRFTYFLDKLEIDKLTPANFNRYSLGIRRYASFSDRLNNPRSYVYLPFSYSL